MKRTAKHFLGQHSHLTLTTQIQDADYFERGHAVLWGCVTNNRAAHTVIEEIILDLVYVYLLIFTAFSPRYTTEI